VSDPIDIKALDEYLKGGSDISQRYHELGAADVPPELDRRVLDEARAAVAGGGAARSRSWLRWSAPVALAASVVLVVAVVIESPVQDEAIAIRPASEEIRALDHSEDSRLKEETAQAQAQPEPEVQMYVPEQPSAIAPAAAPSAPPPSVASVSKSERKRADDAPVEEVVATAQARPTAVLEAPTPVSVLTDESLARNEVDPAGDVAADSAAKVNAQLQEVVITGNRQRRAAGRTAGPRNTISGSVFSGERRPTADADAEQADPEKRLEEIRDLRREGKTAEADREWERFLEEYPNFPVAEDDLARKKR
jgi:hypothetical protein